MTGNVEYRVNPTLDNETLNHLFSRSWPEHVVRDFQPVLGQALGWLGAFDEQQLIGFVYLATDGGIHAFLLDPTVDPAFRRRGIGVQLVKRAAALARSRQCRWLHVDYEPSLAPFYHAAGFRDSAAAVIELDGATSYVEPFVKPMRKS